MADGVIAEGQSFYGYQSFGDGCVFINCYFEGGFGFGTGCVFIGCTFGSNRFRGGASHVGPDAVFSDGASWWRFGRRDPSHSVADRYVTSGGWTELGRWPVVNKGENITQDKRIQDGDPIHYDGTKGGQAADNKTDNNWCAVECSPAHVGTVVTGKGGATVVDNGQTTQINGGAGGSGGGSGGSGGSGGGNGMPSNPPDDEIRP